MNKRITIKRLLVVAVILTVAVAVVAAPRVNPAKGKVFYKKHCRPCHDGSTEVPELSPMSKTMEQWGREFAEGGAVGGCTGAVEEKTGAKLTEQDLLDIQAYLVQHAADSDQPATCGN